MSNEHLRNLYYWKKNTSQCEYVVVIIDGALIEFEPFPSLCCGRSDSRPQGKAVDGVRWSERGISVGNGRGCDSPALGSGGCQPSIKLGGNERPGQEASVPAGLLCSVAPELLLAWKPWASQSAGLLSLPAFKETPRAICSQQKCQK